MSGGITGMELDLMSRMVESMLHGREIDTNKNKCNVAYCL